MLVSSATLLPLGDAPEQTAQRPEPSLVSAHSVFGGTMDRSQPTPTRTLAQLEDNQDLASVISAALAKSPVDITSLRRGVWTYVGEERHAGISPGRVILALTELIDASVRMSAMERGAVTKRVILWCVEAYFGQLGGEVARTHRENGALPTPLKGDLHGD